MTTPPKRAYSANTRLLHADRLGGVEHGALHKPLHVSAAFDYPTARDLVEVFQGHQPGHVYARQGNPTVNALEAKVTLMEDAKGTVTFATGMAAITAVFLALLRAGDHLVCTRFLFGNTNSLMQTLQGWAWTSASSTRPRPATCAPPSRRPRAWCSSRPSPTRARKWPTWTASARSAARRPAVRRRRHDDHAAAVRGRDVGAGLVVNSLSKNIGGHGNALGGAVVDTGLFDWSAYPNILPPYKKARPTSGACCR